MSKSPKIIVIVGPTASGKSALGIELSRRFGGEVVSADSRQVYRGMDIGTGKVTKREMRGVRHHLLDVASPRATFTAARYQKLGRAAVKKILARGKIPIVVGGTGFYIDSLLYDYHLPSVKPNAALRRLLKQESAEVLFEKLRKLDPRRARAIDRHNRRRLVRALEIVMTTKRPIPRPDEALSRKRIYDVLKIGLNPPQKKLSKNIHARLMRRLRQGMVREVQNLHEPQPRGGGLSSQRLDNFGLEYRFISRYLRRLITKKEMVTKIEKESCRYAKRQMTWFKRDKIIHWIADKKDAIPLVKKFLGARIHG